MKGKSIKILQGMLWFVCCFHLIVGAGLNLFPGMAPLMAQAYGATVEWTPEFEYILKPLGAFMFSLGLICITAARDPLNHRMVIYGFVTLFVVRALQRLVFAKEISDNFGIDSSRNIVNMFFFLGMAAVLVVCEWQARKTADNQGTASA